jgi:carbon starvation protein
MLLAADSPLIQDLRPNALYAHGIGSFLAVLGVPAALGVSFGLMAFTTFVYDTLDVCTRLGRYVVQELSGWHGRFGRIFATALTAGLPLYFLLSEQADPVTGKIMPAWRTFWGLFGASNQLLAALTLVGVTVWLWQTRRARWVWFVTGLPAAFMYTISVWELGRLVVAGFRDGVSLAPVPWLSALLIVLAALMLVEAVKVIFARSRPPAPRAPVAVAT